MWDWAINTANPRFDAQQAEIDALQAQVAAMDTYVQQLQAYVEVDDLTNPLQPVVRVVAANLQLINGDGATESMNGTGNLIIGYNEAWGTTVACADGYYNEDQVTCEEEGSVWAAKPSIRLTQSCRRHWPELQPLRWISGGSVQRYKR